jgi:hypothetical protein
VNALAFTGYRRGKESRGVLCHSRPASATRRAAEQFSQLGSSRPGGMTAHNKKIQPSPEVIAKAEELTKVLADDDAKLRAIYNYVSLRYRYVAIAFGIGRYQPHASKEHSRFHTPQPLSGAFETGRKMSAMAIFQQSGATFPLVRGPSKD